MKETSEEAEEGFVAMTSMPNEADLEKSRRRFENRLIWAKCCFIIAAMISVLLVIYLLFMTWLAVMWEREISLDHYLRIFGSKRP